MTIRSVAPLIAVRDVPSSVAFYGKFGLAPVVESSTYAKLSDGVGAVLHIAAVGDAPPDRPSVALTAPPAEADSVPAIVVIQVADCSYPKRTLKSRPSTAPAGSTSCRIGLQDISQRAMPVLCAQVW